MATNANGWSRRPRQRLAAALGTLVLFALLTACHRAPAQQQIRHAIDVATAAARANDPAGVLAVVSDDFVGNDGELDRRGLRQFLALRALRHDRTGVLTGPVTFDRTGDRAVARFNLVLTGGESGDLLPGHATILAMTTAWRRDGGKWLCYNATWRRGPD